MAPDRIAGKLLVYLWPTTRCTAMAMFAVRVALLVAACAWARGRLCERLAGAACMRPLFTRPYAYYPDLYAVDIAPVRPRLLAFDLACALAVCCLLWRNRAGGPQWTATPWVPPPYYCVNQTVHRYPRLITHVKSRVLNRQLS